MVDVEEGPRRIQFTLRRVALAAPFRKRFPLAVEDVRRYREVVRMGWSVGAYDGARLVGLAIAEPRAWNRSVWVWELGVSPACRRQGIGTGLVRDLVRRARARGYRVLVCETQTTNAPAIAFYVRAGFRLEGLDLSYYTNQDLRKGEVALFMKKRVPAARRSRGSHGRARRRRVT